MANNTFFIKKVTQIDGISCVFSNFQEFLVSNFYNLSLIHFFNCQLIECLPKIFDFVNQNSLKPSSKKVLLSVIPKFENITKFYERFHSR